MMTKDRKSLESSYQNNVRINNPVRYYKGMHNRSLMNHKTYDERSKNKTLMLSLDLKNNEHRTTKHYGGTHLAINTDLLINELIIGHKHKQPKHAQTLTNDNMGERSHSPLMKKLVRQVKRQSAMVHKRISIK